MIRTIGVVVGPVKTLNADVVSVIARRATTIWESVMSARKASESLGTRLLTYADDRAPRRREEEVLM